MSLEFVESNICILIATSVHISKTANFLRVSFHMLLAVISESKPQHLVPGMFFSTAKHRPAPQNTRAPPSTALSTAEPEKLELGGAAEAAVPEL